MQVVVGVIYLAVGVLQWFATLDGLQHWVGLPWLLALIASLLIAYIPGLGTIVGTAGAISIWGWPWPQAVGLFFGPLLVIGAIILISSGIESMWRR